MKWAAFRAAFPYTIPIFAGFWFLGLAASALCLQLFGSQSFIIPAMLCILVVLTLIRGPLERKGI